MGDDGGYGDSSGGNGGGNWGSNNNYADNYNNYSYGNDTNDFSNKYSSYNDSKEDKYSAYSDSKNEESRVYSMVKQYESSKPNDEVTPKYDDTRANFAESPRSEQISTSTPTQENNTSNPTSDVPASSPVVSSESHSYSSKTEKPQESKKEEKDNEFGDEDDDDDDDDVDDDDPWNNVDQGQANSKSTKTHRKRSTSKVTESRTLKIKIKTEADESKSWNVKAHQLTDPDVKIKVEAGQEIAEDTSDEESNDNNEGATIRKTSFKNIISKYVGYNIDDLNTIDKNRARRVSTNEDTDASTKKKRGRNKSKEASEETGEEKAKTDKKKPKKVSLLTLEELDEKRKEHEIMTLERKRKKLAKRESKKKNIDLNKKPSDMDNIFASLDEMESSEEEDEGNDEDWDEIHLGMFSLYEYKCRVCDWKLNSYDKLLRHIKSDHGGYETSSLCSHCGYYSKNRSTLKNHVRVEHGENQAKRKEKKICDICSAEVVHLAIHKKHSHSGTYHVCPHCGKKFTRKAELQLHIKGIHMKHQLEKTCSCMQSCRVHFFVLDDEMTCSCMQSSLVCVG
uniref:Transcriptional repressor CTCF n=1 Tax=Cacopsylla melanoneura TaxID=428564 RepID=A0A8D9A1G1_9HEMI